MPKLSITALTAQSSSKFRSTWFVQSVQIQKIICQYRWLSLLFFIYLLFPVKLLSSFFQKYWSCHFNILTDFVDIIVAIVTLLPALDFYCLNSTFIAIIYFAMIVLEVVVAVIICLFITLIIQLTLYGCTNYDIKSLSLLQKYLK